MRSSSSSKSSPALMLANRAPPAMAMIVAFKPGAQRSLRDRAAGWCPASNGSKAALVEGLGRFLLVAEAFELFLLAEPQDLAAQLFDIIRRRRFSSVSRRVDRLSTAPPWLSRLQPSDVAVDRHAIEHPVAAINGRFGVVVRVHLARALRQAASMAHSASVRSRQRLAEIRSAPRRRHPTRNCRRDSSRSCRVRGFAAW